MCSFVRQLITIIVLAHCALCVSGQQNIIGKVVDAEFNTPIDNAVVTMVDSVTMAVKSYTISNNDVNFELKQSNGCNLQVSKLGYKTVLVPS